MKLNRSWAKAKKSWKWTRSRIRRIKRSKAWKALRKKRRLYYGLLALLVFFLFLLVNIFVQTYRKPAEIVGLADARFYKTPAATWEAYSHLFKRHATSVATADFLAALAQVESEGNPIARARWVWRWSGNPFRWYGPPSSSTGMYQMTHGNFQDAKRFCIHEGQVVQEGRWYEFKSCWFNGLYNRLVPSHAIEMTSAYLTHQTQILLAKAIETYSKQRQQRLAAAIHLCGPEYGRKLVRRRLRLQRNERCGSHNLFAYIIKVERLMIQFQALD